MRVAVVIIAALWGIAGVLALAKTQGSPLDARLTAAYILLWPVLAVILLLNDPVPQWLAVPTVFGFIPWLMAGPHLWAVLKDPSQIRPDELIGIPTLYWGWGGLAAIALGVVFG